MAVAVAEVEMMRQTVQRIHARPEPRSCPMCQMAGEEVLMVPGVPLPHHYHCSVCGYLEIEWHPILQRVKRLLEEYTFAQIRLAQEPVAPIAHYGVALTAGGETTSQQEAYMMRNQRDIKLVAFVDEVMRSPYLSTEQREIVRLHYFERWRVPRVARKLNLEPPTVYEKVREALKVFARAKGWAVGT